MQVLPELFVAYERGGANGVHKFIVNLVSTILREVYGRYGLTFDGEISFSRLVDAGVIDEDTAVYLTTVYMAVEGLLEELEEAEDLGNKNAVHNVLHKMAAELQKLITELLNATKPKQ